MPPTPTFAVIAEGPTDFTVLRQLLAGVFTDPDIVVNQLQPAVDATSGHQSPGGWYEVFRYLASDRLAGAFDRNDYVVIHIDTDVCEEPYFAVARLDPGGAPRDIDTMLALTRERLIGEIDPALFERVHHRIIFAIAVESIECWLLPLYYETIHRTKTVNCLGTLNQKLTTAEGFSINPERKEVKRYQTIVRRRLRRAKDIEAAAPHNPSFAAFISALRPILNPPVDAG